MAEPTTTGTTRSRYVTPQSDDPTPDLHRDGARARAEDVPQDVVFGLAADLGVGGDEGVEQIAPRSDRTVIVQQKQGNWRGVSL
ncbi:hypothetical protein [Streptomyces caelestis]|uniref:hypothetical protein n=1 Tax=Streptomyces caelestis TaxID=36816 RepID=UPI0036F60BEF